MDPNSSTSNEEGKRTREEQPNSGNPAPRQQARREEDLHEVIRMLSEANATMITNMMKAMKDQSRQEDRSLTKLITRIPYKGVKWNSTTGDNDLAVQLAEFIPAVERHVKRSWKVNPEDAAADPDGEILKAVENSIGIIPKTAWFDQWVTGKESSGQTPTWPAFKLDATTRFLKTETYAIHRIQDLLAIGIGF